MWKGLLISLGTHRTKAKAKKEKVPHSVGRHAHSDSNFVGYFLAPNGISVRAHFCVFAPFCFSLFAVCPRLSIDATGLGSIDWRAWMAGPSIRLVEPGTGLHPFERQSIDRRLRTARTIPAQPASHLNQPPTPPHTPQQARARQTGRMAAAAVAGAATGTAILHATSIDDFDVGQVANY